MSPHFCKVGKIKINSSKFISLKDIEKTIANFVDDISKVEFPKDAHGAL
jgi:ketopantoate hydroxymethyltransferase